MSTSKIYILAMSDYEVETASSGSKDIDYETVSESGIFVASFKVVFLHSYNVM